MHSMLGDPIHGELHTADASAGVQVPIYTMGSLTARTLQPYEYIEIHALEIVSAPGGDLALFINTVNTLLAGTVVVRATSGTTGGLVMSRMYYEGINGGLPFVIAPVGVTDVLFLGTIRNAKTQGVRPNWRDRLNA